MQWNDIIHKSFRVGQLKLSKSRKKRVNFYCDYLSKERGSHSVPVGVIIMMYNFSKLIPKSQDLLRGRKRPTTG